MRHQELLANPQSDWLTDWRARSPSIIVAATVCFLATGVLALGAWQFTGNEAWVVEFFQVPAALMMIWLAMLELLLSQHAARNFAPDDLLRSGWTLIALSAGCQFLGSMLSQVLGAESRLNPLMYEPGWRESLIPTLRQVGHIIGGTFRFALLSAGLHYALKAYRRSGFLGRLKPIDWAVLGLMAAYLGLNVADVTFAIRRGKHPDAWELLSWPTDPLLVLLLGQGLLLFRSAQRMGSGMLGRCWKALAAGVFLTALGDVGQFAINSGYLAWPWEAVTWYLWLPAAGALACAPAFQLDVIRHANTSATR